MPGPHPLTALADVRPCSGSLLGGNARCMTTEDRVAKLEGQIDKLQKQQADLRKRLAKAQLD